MERKEQAIAKSYLISWWNDPETRQTVQLTLRNLFHNMALEFQQ